MSQKWRTCNYIKIAKRAWLIKRKHQQGLIKLETLICTYISLYECVYLKDKKIKRLKDNCQVKKDAWINLSPKRRMKKLEANETIAASNLNTYTLQVTLFLFINSRKQSKHFLVWKKKDKVNIKGQKSCKIEWKNLSFTVFGVFLFIFRTRTVTHFLTCSFKSYLNNNKNKFSEGAIKTNRY